MSTIYGVDSALYHRLPAEDQAAIRQSHQDSAQPETAAAAPQQAEPQPAPAVEQAQTPQEAVEALHDLPPPDDSDLQDMPADMRAQTLEQRTQTYNATRAQAAEDALDRMQPQKSDFDTLPPATAQAEYESARSDFNQNPYANELRRIAEEARTKPDQIPAYLTASNDGSQADIEQFTPEQVSATLAQVGIEIPADAPADVMAAGRELLGTMPDALIGMLVNPGAQVSFAGGGGGGTPNLVGPTASYDLQVQGRVELGDVQTGVNFNQTQQFKASVQVQQGGELGYHPSLPQYLNEWSGRLQGLSDSTRNTLERIPGFNDLDRTLDGVRQNIDDVPALRALLKKLPISGSYGTFEGQRLSYEAVVTPQQGQALENGDSNALPNPLDPLNMPPGTSVMMRGQDLQGSAFELNYKALTLGGTHTELSGQGFGVTRGEGSIVEIYAGPVDTVENATFFGIGRQGIAAAGVGTELSMENRSMQVARLDLSTAEGQAAYQQFINSGKIPEWSPPGVQQSGTTEVFSHEYARSIGLQVGGAEFGLFDNANGTITRTTWADGTSEYTNSYTDALGVTSEVSYPLDAAGNPDYDNARWTIVRADLHPAQASYLETSYDPSKRNQFADGPQHVQMTLTSDDLIELRDKARNYVQQEYGQERLNDLDSERVPASPDSVEALAIADSPEEVFYILNDSHGKTIETLLMLSMHSGTPTPGDFRITDAEG